MNMPNEIYASLVFLLVFLYVVILWAICAATHYAKKGDGNEQSR